MPKIAYHADGNLNATFKDFFAKARKRFLEQEDVILTALNERIMALTPVWEGDTLANWRWSTRAPIFEHVEPKGQSIPTGETNKMDLGQEPRRTINSTRPRQSLAGALGAREPVDIYLTNSSDSAVGLEYGLLPGGPGQRSRSPRGIVRLAIKEVMGNFR